MGVVHEAPIDANGAAYRTGIAAIDSSRGPRTILHVVSSLGVGGMERMLLQLPTAQQEAGHRVSVLALPSGRYSEQEAAVSVDPHQGSVERRRASWSKSRSAPFFLGREPAHRTCPQSHSLQYAVLSKLVSHPAIVVTIHGDQDTHARLGSSLEWKLTSAAVIVSHAAGKTPAAPVSCRTLHRCP